jgi:hypothetical protein
VGSESVPEDIQRTLQEKVVLGVVGALNETYYVPQTLTLAKFATQLSPKAHLLVLTAQRREYEAALGTAGIAPERYTVATALHTSMPDWLQWIDWGLLLIPETVANRAKVPTKLAEFFATGVRPMFYGCNVDVARWVERAGSGYVLRSVDEGSLLAGARNMTEEVADRSLLRGARDATAPHFGLAAAMDRYCRVVDHCLSSRASRGQALGSSFIAPNGVMARRIQRDSASAS